MFDLEMMKEMGYCHGIENYSRHLSGRLPGEPPPTLLDYLPHDSLMFIDESHQTVPQLHGMYHGDRSRKQVLVAHGFRLPSALDNRPLTFEEFEHRVNQVVYVSATPGPYELTKSAGVVVEQIIRPTGLVDPEIEIRPIKGQVDDLLNEIRNRTANNQRVLVTTLTKRMAEDLAEYYSEVGVKCNYLHSEVSTLDRIKILRDLRRGEHDVLIGINLLREGLDLPEVSLVAILDADKEGFLRSSGALIQTIGRAARHLEGRAILYADVMTDSMKRAIDETTRRRVTQLQYNEDNGIIPQSIIKPIDMSLIAIAEGDYVTVPAEPEESEEELTPAQRMQFIGDLENRMREAARTFEFEKAAQIRDRIKHLRAKGTSRALESRFKYGVLGAGAVAKSLIGRLPARARDLGPVSAVSFRLASRIANALRAGYAARTADEMNVADVVLFHSPPEQAEALLEMLDSAEIHWIGTALIFCDCDDVRAARARFQAKGASTAVARQFGIPGRIVVAGNGSALTAANHIVRELKLKAVEILPGATDIFDAAVTLGNSAITPLIDHAAGLLRDAGIRDAEAAQIASALFSQTASEYARSGKQSWAWYMRQPEIERIEGQIAAAGAHLGPVLRGLLLFGLGTFEKYPAVARALRNLPKKSVSRS